MVLSGTLAALTSGLPKQPVTSHPSVKDRLEKGTPARPCQVICNSPGDVDFEYKEDNVVVSGHLVTRFVLLLSS